LTTSPTPHVRVPRHVSRHVVWLVVDYFTSRRLVVDYFAYAARPGTSARCAVRRGSSSTTFPTLRDSIPRHIVRLIARHVTRLVGTHFAYDVRSGASAPRAACHWQRTVSSPRCTGSTAPTSCTLTRHVTARLLVGRLHWLSPCAPSLCLADRLLRAWSPRLCLAATLALLQPRRASRLLFSWQHRC
jgi:hypothetical protein